MTAGFLSLPPPPGTNPFLCIAILKSVTISNTACRPRVRSQSWQQKQTLQFANGKLL